ncbi:uroporphyrinogen decarboxylase family protein [Geosporobacter ferrireducens]|uniref:Uroporphyrinogen decarboxylase n=1 Tax=Geosporobacter ferrireducens TaxID=1424294 RepID=A0A1D8GKS8_9FIRM|nr:uroporphyrinogen decarboxylase family protein [Geosporobacter ferrireducens]AOT71493.1 uroporphyrinogen decarboxylase [Geosporobacter ferrireducens]MTI57803.1 uroporphyrinogen decarboxylase [Geosporobacter ferrireducens]
MSEMSAQAKERNQLFQDIDEGKIPKRVPVYTWMDITYIMQYAGVDLKKAQWDVCGFRDMIEVGAKSFASDINPATFTRLYPVYRILGAKNFIMSSEGQIQHPEITGMGTDEYDEMIKDPYKFMHDKIFPRLYTNLDTTPARKAMVFAKAQKAFFDIMGHIAAADAEMNAKYGLADDRVVCQSIAPFDQIADQFRSFSGISADIRRHPEKVFAACEAVLPMMLKAGVKSNSSVSRKTFIPLHMAPYMREKDFEKFYWPTFKKLVDGLWAAGAGVLLFVEHDWTRFLDYLNELPKGTQMMFEYGDPKTIKEKVGKKHIISGLYPLTLLAQGTKQQCIDKAKALIDILAPGGNYIFSFDKVALNIKDAKPENIIAVNEFVREYAVY